MDQWIEVNPKHYYPVGTVFILRWLPEGGTNYKTETLGKMGLHLAKIACASFEAKDEAETKPVEKPKTLVEFRTAFLKDKDATFKKDGSPLDADTNRVSAVPHDVEPSCWRRDFVGPSEAGPAENMNAKSKIGLVVGALAGSLLFDFLALSKDWPTPGAYLIEWLFHPGAVPDVKTDLRIVWAVDAGVFVATNFLCCLAIFYVVYLMLRKRL